MKSVPYDSLSALEQEWVDIHNRFRCLHDVPPLTWNHDIANNARQYAILRITECFDLHSAPNAKCLLKHSSPATRSNIAGYSVLGENLASLNGQRHDPGAPSIAVQMWYNEITMADDAYGTTTQFKHSIGHYTQVIFKSTREVGCSVFPDDSLEGKRHKIANTIFVCQYGPAQLNTGPDGKQVMQPNILPRKINPSSCTNPQVYAASLGCVPCGECSINQAVLPSYYGAPAVMRRRRCERPTTTLSPSVYSGFMIERRNSGTRLTLVWPNPGNPKADYELKACANECKAKGSTYFIYGKSARNKDCGCVKPGQTLDTGDGNTNWDVYKITATSTQVSSTRTTTTTRTTALLKVSGTMTLDVADPLAFTASTAVNIAMKSSIADFTGVPVSNVEVTINTVRRLLASPRRLAAVRVTYVVTYPTGTDVTAQAALISSKSAAHITTVVNSELTSAGLSLAVIVASHSAAPTTKRQSKGNTSSSNRQIRTFAAMFVVAKGFLSA